MFDDAGVLVRASYDAMANCSGGRENLRFTRSDLYNLVRTVRRTPMIHGEGHMLLDHFRAESNNNAGFYHEVKMDGNNIESIFWADATMQLDYQCFGDSITFDTTYRTNNEYRPLGLFAGFNHRQKLTIFGAALLYEETTEGFKWVFESFLRCMKEKHPTSIFTDQCPAIAAGINSIFPNTFHGLCTFHINQNAKRRMGKLTNEVFLNELQFLMYEVDTEEQFDTAWREMIDKCFPGKGPDGHSWLVYIHKFRKQWSSVWVKNNFICGMRSSQLSESLNSNLRGYLHSKDNLSTFFTQFQRMLDNKRADELELDYQATNNAPVNRFKSNNLVCEAAKVC
ncbi:Protein FAR1-RELATED SEQUENCE 5 [Linum perenne]